MSELLTIPVENIVPNPEQPRVDFDPAEIASLAESIEEHGLIQPITVEERQDGYVPIDGERRLRAVKSLGLSLIKAVVRTYDEPPVDKLSQAVVANMQRSDLNPIEEGEAFKKLYQQKMTISTIARTVGRSIGHVNTRLKMLEFEPEIKELFAKRKLPIDQQMIWDLLKLPEEQRVSMAIRYAASGMSGAGIKRSLTRILRNLEQPDTPLRGKRRSPAAIMSNMPAENRMTDLAGKDSAALPQWELIEKAAAETCAACDLNDIASAQMCKDCPAVELLKRLSKLVVMTN